MGHVKVDPLMENKNKPSYASVLASSSSIHSLSTLSSSDLTMTSEPVIVERGLATNENKIFKCDGGVFHGSWRDEFVSFILYDTVEEAHMSKILLQTFGTAEFVNPKTVISETKVWLVVQKIDSTLGQFEKKNSKIWYDDYQLDAKYKIIVRRY